MNWVLVMILSMPNGATTMMNLSPYSEAECHRAADQFEAGAAPTPKGMRRMSRTAYCIVGPNLVMSEEPR